MSPSDLRSLAQNVGSWGKSGSRFQATGGPLLAKPGLMHCSILVSSRPTKVRRAAPWRRMQEQLVETERERDRAPTPCAAKERKRHDLLRPNGIGPTFAAILVIFKLADVTVSRGRKSSHPEGCGGKPFQRR